MFPKISGSNLEGEELQIPSDLHGKYNILALAYRRNQQDHVDQWSSFIGELLLEYSDLDFYEVPTLAKGYSLMSFIIDGGMRAGIPSKNIRKHTITLYTNKRKLNKQLKVKSENNIQLFLIDREGKILWREKGKITDKKKNSLESKIKKLFNK
ncbi:MAG: hypothetical protein U9O98_05675 [Asgard group archaeon]|nr:hypothetical protein [Asgard group archaeon]